MSNSRSDSRPLRRPAARSPMRRGSSQLRMRVGFLVIAMVLSIFGARLVQLQAVDPGAYAQLAADQGTVDVVLPSDRGEILDRNGAPLAESVDGLMIIADPQLVNTDEDGHPLDRAPELARLLSTKLDLDYFTVLKRLRATDSRFQYIARAVPAAQATAVVDKAEELGFQGLTTRRDPVRVYPSDDVASNLIGFLGTPHENGTARPLAGFERTFNDLLAGKDGSARYSVDSVANGNRIPLGQSTVVQPVNGKNLKLTIDRDLQWYTQRVLRKTVEDARADSGVAIVLDSRNGQTLALADYPSYDANHAIEAPKEDLGSRALSDVYEPGSVEKVLTLSGLIDAGKVTDRTKLRVPGSLARQDRVIHDWFPHGLIKLTLAGVIAKSSNIGTVLAADKFAPGQLRNYLVKFGLGQRTGVGVNGESPGILPSSSQWTSQTQDRIAFGQSVSVNALQMAAAVNTIANGGIRIDPSLILGSATTDAGQNVGSADATTRRVVSSRAAKQMTSMMERVVDPEAGVAPGAQVPGYVVAGKTGTAQRANPDCGCYDGTFTVSFAGFAPADKPRFTVYVVVQNPRNGGGGGSVGGPAFSKIMSYALSRYGVAPTNATPSKLPVEW